MEYLLPAFLVVIVTSIGLYLRWLRKNDDYFKKLGIPYTPRQSIISVLNDLKALPVHELLLIPSRKYGKVYGGFEMRKPVLTINDPNLLRDILVKDFQAFHYRRDFADFGDSTVNKMVSLLKGEDWKRVRTIITPSFTSKRMREMSHVMNECSQTTIEILRKYAEKNEPADLKGIFGAFTMDVIASAAFATKIDSHNDPENIFVQKNRDAFSVPSQFGLILLFILPVWIAKRIKLSVFSSAAFFRDVVVQVVKERKSSGKRYDDILQLLIDAQEELKSENSNHLSKPKEDDADQIGSKTNKGMVYQQKYKTLSKDELIANAVLFFVVGYETTASTLALMAYCLASNPECQEKLIAEVDEIFEKHNEINYDVIQNMKYLDYVLSETLRLYPSVTRSVRTAAEDYKLGDTGITIKKGLTIGFNIHAMHLNPEYFPNPEKFDPERFTSENANHPQYAYLPFGAGPRNCPGMRFSIIQIKLCMSNILRHYRFKEFTKDPLQFKKAKDLLSVHELPLLVERRNI